MTVWLYTPTSPPDPGLGLVLVAPAGSPLITGMRLADGDRDEHIPYVQAGYAVISYSLDGAIDEEADDAALLRGLEAFRAAQAGLVNARTALDFALRHLPEPDLSRIYAVGHSSAATHALLVAAFEPRVRAVAAYAAVVDVREYLGAAAVLGLSANVPGYGRFLDQASPIRHSKALATKPVYLFAARDDGDHVGHNRALMDAMGAPHPSTRNVVVASGGHYDSMLAEGIPGAIEWFHDLEAP